MTTTETVTPPECCPVCGARQTPSSFQFVAGFITQIYDCGATFSGLLNVHPDTPWHSPCPRAMTAALRCGATLHPTAKETATAALVEAAVAEYVARRTYLDSTEAAGVNQLEVYAGAKSDRLAAVAAYLAAQEPRP